MMMLIAVVYASRTWICTLWLMLCRMPIGMSCSIIYDWCQWLHWAYRLCIDGVIYHIDVLCFRCFTCGFVHAICAWLTGWCHLIPWLDRASLCYDGMVYGQSFFIDWVIFKIVYCFPVGWMSDSSCMSDDSFSRVLMPWCIDILAWYFMQLLG